MVGIGSIGGSMGTMAKNMGTLVCVSDLGIMSGIQKVWVERLRLLLDYKGASACSPFAIHLKQGKPPQFRV